MTVIDLSHTIEETMSVYPGMEAPRLETVSTYEQDLFRETLISMFSHTGTHMDAPAHIFPEGKTLDQLPADQFLGMALVIDCRDLKEGDAITIAHINPYGADARRADFLLFNLGWDRFWGSDAYFGAFPCMDDDVLDFIIQGSYKGIGVDTISIDPMNSLTRHRKLFRGTQSIIIENLKDLHNCSSGLFHFSCFPLKLKAGDGSPVRAVAWFD